MIKSFIPSQQGSINLGLNSWQRTGSLSRRNIFGFAAVMATKLYLEQIIDRARTLSLCLYALSELNADYSSFGSAHRDVVARLREVERH